MTFKKKLNILIIDDHPILISAYKKILQKKYEDSVRIDVCHFYDLLIDKLKTEHFDVLFIDLELNSSETLFELSIESFSNTIKKSFPSLKIILVLSEKRALFQRALKSAYNAILIKKDIKKNVISDSLETVLNGKKFYSKTALKLKYKTKNQELLLDNLDLKILENLSLGIKTKNLPETIPLSLSAIEKRKNKIKTVLDADTDENLLRKARIAGLI